MIAAIPPRNNNITKIRSSFLRVFTNVKLSIFVLLSPFIFYLTPLIPLSFKGEGEVLGKRGFAPLRRPFV